MAGLAGLRHYSFPDIHNAHLPVVVSVLRPSSCRCSK